ncbi:hypothetical protein HanPI659440_Chr07g0266441 [Helianthus annuus]|nr:hypothetical protein HanPI659440_Chr07g0266441 [Helianthus annuus]
MVSSIFRSGGFDLRYSDLVALMVALMKRSKLKPMLLCSNVQRPMKVVLSVFSQATSPQGISYGVWS